LFHPNYEVGYNEETKKAFVLNKRLGYQTSTTAFLEILVKLKYLTQKGKGCKWNWNVEEIEKGEKAIPEVGIKSFNSLNKINKQGSIGAAETCIWVREDLKLKD
jgi:hypothetical protein